MIGFVSESLRFNVGMAVVFFEFATRTHVCSMACCAWTTRAHTLPTKYLIRLEATRQEANNTLPWHIIETDQHNLCVILLIGAIVRGLKVTGF